MNHESGIMNGNRDAHHAYVVMGGAEAPDELFKMLERSLAIATKGNPDFHYQKFESFTVDEARALKAQEEQKAFAPGAKKIFVIEADSITMQAQNSLLKMFEEPTVDSHFFLVGNCVKNLIPTLLSRVATMELESAPTAPPAAGGAKAFLSLSVPERLAFVKKLSDDIKDEKKTKSEALSLVQEIESAVYTRSKKAGGTKTALNEAYILEDIEMCRGYLGDSGASVKMLLEYVALIVPHVA